MYLAEVTDPNLLLKRAKLKTDLEQFGVHIVPGPNAVLPETVAELEQAVVAALRKAQFSVHILGNTYGEPIAGSDRSIANVQYDCATRVAAESKGKLTNMVWIAAADGHDQLDHDGDDTLQQRIERQQEFLDSIEKQSGPGAPEEIIRDTYESFKQSLESLVQKLLPPPKRISILGIEQGLDDDIGKLIASARQRRHMVVKFTVPKADQYHRVNPRCCEDIRDLALRDGLVILYGQQETRNLILDTALWVVTDSLKKPLALGIYDGPPLEKDELGLYGDHVLVMNCRKGFSDTELEPFLKRIEPGPIPHLTSLGT